MVDVRIPCRVGDDHVRRRFASKIAYEAIDVRFFVGQSAFREISRDNPVAS
jgi:hypothetical protein